MERWSYEEITQYIRDDFSEFLMDDLNVKQATSRVQVEYQNIIEESSVEKLFIYIVLAKLGLEHGTLRDDIKEEVLKMITEEKLLKIKDDLTPNEYKNLMKDTHDLLSLINSR
ncbi:Imm3 family immunity protein [Paludifilum halophilum]|uniref:Uncharacterized protein n=1 Tax=Paludifilum halophilum TaxID=1642702 RepID=A0A235B826_9BACL|nr:Imm3 family immunity protein [Paludifilum halophilum]OYD07745.1 hypothetical protein CHM34_09750 [Paludifilum halophilum]